MRELFALQKFRRLPRLQAILDKVGEKYGFSEYARALEEDELDLFAAGDADSMLKEGGRDDKL